jgi:hypothetical protein
MPISTVSPDNGMGVRLGYVRRLRLLAQDQQPAEDGGKSRTNWLHLIHHK